MALGSVGALVRVLAGPLTPPLGGEFVEEPVVESDPFVFALPVRFCRLREIAPPHSEAVSPQLTISFNSASMSSVRLFRPERGTQVHTTLLNRRGRMEDRENNIFKFDQYASGID